MDVLSAIMQVIIDHVLAPVTILIGTSVLYVLKHKFDKSAKDIVARDELNDLEKQSNIRKELMETIAGNVESAVASNMQLADAMKKGGHKLTEDQIKQLSDSAKALVMNSLPLSLTEPGGVLNEVIGGPDKLNSIIDSLMEKYVYEYKVKKMQAEGIISSEDYKTEPVQKPPMASQKPNRGNRRPLH